MTFSVFTRLALFVLSLFDFALHPGGGEARYLAAPRPLADAVAASSSEQRVDEDKFEAHFDEIAYCRWLVMI